MTTLNRVVALTSLIVLSFAVAFSRNSEETTKRATNECPVQASLTVVAGEVKQTAQLVLTLRIAEPWYIYVKSSRSAVLEIDLQLPPGVVAPGEWTKPKPRPVYQDERVEIYTGEQVLRRGLRLSSTASAAEKIIATIRFQACDPTVCRPPEEITAAVNLGPAGAP